MIAAGASALVFELTVSAADDYDETIRDVCRMAPRLARYDADLTEAYDDAGRDLDLLGIRQFTQRYQHRLRTCEIDFGGFQRKG